MISKNITLPGLTCGACAKVSEMKIRKIDGVEEVHIIQQGSEGQGSINSSREIGLEEVQKALADTHYQVKIYN